MTTKVTVWQFVMVLPLLSGNKIENKSRKKGCQVKKFPSLKCGTVRIRQV